MNTKRVTNSNKKMNDELPSFIYDAHCHIESTISSGVAGKDDNCFATKIDGVDQSIHLVSNIMSTNPEDYKYCMNLTKNLINDKEQRLFLQNFGVHPWYCHLFTLEKDKNIDKKTHYQEIINWGKHIDTFNEYDLLPDPINVDDYIENHFFPRMGNSLESKAPYPWIGIGEVGLDKLAVCNEPTLLTKNIRVKVKMEHQINVFKKFLALSLKYEKPISIHAVKCQGVLFNELLHYGEHSEKITVPIVLHSFTGSKESLYLFMKHFPKCYVSLSQFINVAQEKHLEMIKEIPIDRVLCETDMPITNFYTDKICANNDQIKMLMEVVSMLATIHNLSQAAVINQLNDNFLKIYNYRW